MIDAGGGREVVERAVVGEADELAAGQGSVDGAVVVAGARDPLAAVAQDVLGVGVDRRGDVRRQRPRRRRPHDQRLARPVAQREADEERRVGAVAVDVGLQQLVLGDRGPAARAPLGRAVGRVQPAALVDDLEEAPDVLDVRVREREVVGAPVHPLAEPLRAARELLGRPDDLLAAAAGELGEPVGLDLALRVEPELALDADLDPEALAVEAVLVALVEAAHRAVALEDVLEGAAPGGVDGEDLVGRHRAVDEAPARPAAVALADALERAPLLPQVEDLELEARMVGLRRQPLERRSGHRPDTTSPPERGICRRAGTAGRTAVPRAPGARGTVRSAWRVVYETRIACRRTAVPSRRVITTV